MTRSVTRTDAARVAEPIAAPRAIRQRRFRGGAMALAVLFIALGGLLAGLAYMAVVKTQDVLAVARPVQVGSQITAADVTTVQINDAPGLAPIGADQLSRVVGKRAAVSLVPGTLLTARQLTDQALVQPGQRQVGVGLSPSRLPARTLRPGDQVQLVSTPADGTVTGTSTPAAPEKFDATVVDVSVSTNPSSTSSVVVYLAVSELDAPRVVTLAAQNRITMVLRVGS
ncbi:MAG TPA: SAF domain-containing protein [Rugosimonospora sp.]|nr:SAF domain-containing protein [Rugosimonospora sp.]